MDEFDQVDAVEDEYIALGFDEGIEEGRRLGYEEGKDLGEVKGYEVGAEVGFYYGCYLIWKEMTDKDAVPTKARKTIASLGQLIEAYKLENRLDDKILTDLQLIRAKFKVVTAILGHKKLVYNETSIYEHKNMSF